MAGVHSRPAAAPAGTRAAAEIAQAQTLAARVQELTVANWSAEEAIRAQAQATQDAKRRQEELSRAVTATADRLIGAIQQADSFADRAP